MTIHSDDKTFEYSIHFCLTFCKTSAIKQHCLDVNEFATHLVHYGCTCTKPNLLLGVSCEIVDNGCLAFTCSFAPVE